MIPKDFESKEGKSISIEANELLECYQWSDQADLDHVKEDLADVIVYCHNMLDELGLDVDEIVNDKMRRNEERFRILSEGKTINIGVQREMKNCVSKKLFVV